GVEGVSARNLLAIFSIRTRSAGSIPLAMSFLASSRLRLASASETIGYFPNVSDFCLLPKVYCIRQSFDPLGSTRRWRPPPSLYFFTLSRGFIDRVNASVNGIFLASLGTFSTFQWAFREFTTK